MRTSAAAELRDLEEAALLRDELRRSSAATRRRAGSPDRPVTALRYPPLVSDRLVIRGAASTTSRTSRSSCPGTG